MYSCGILAKESCTARQWAGALGSALLEGLKDTGRELLAMVTGDAGCPPSLSCGTVPGFGGMAGAELAEASGMLRAARIGKGNFGLGEATAATAELAGQAWVGKGATLASDGRTLVSQDGLRQYRPASYKPKLGREQANLEWRLRPEGQWQGNGHIDIVK